MKWLALPMLLSGVLSCDAQADGGGRDVSIALFSAQPPSHVTVAAAGPGAWWAPCLTCRHQPLTAALHMPAVHEVIAGGPLSVRDEEDGQVRSTNGGWHLQVTAQGSVDVVLTLPSERYVAAVLMGETLPDEPIESLRALAVVARTFVLRLPAARPAAGHLASDVCESTACQAVRFGPVPDAVNEAVRSTAGETLWFGSQRAQVFFSGSCGGVTETARAVWPKLAGVPYLQSIADPYCVRKDRASWHGEVPVASLQEIARHEGWRLPSRIVSAQVAERTSSQRAKTILLSGGNGERSAVSASAMRLAVGRSLGWNVLRSDAYEVRLRNDVLVFDGNGYGHGVGLCQQGATEMARAGKWHREILAFYFRGTVVRVTLADEGWTRSMQEGITFVGTMAPPQTQVTEAANAWRLARSRFPPLRPVAPTVTFAPTTEVFRQITSQPGWQVASTSGSVIVLQPAAVFAANHLSMKEALQHEMLHVAVEASASAKAPLWLREGLVEVLAGEASYASPSLAREDTDRLLKNAASWQQSRAAHVAAGARTRLLVERYGLSAVRGWLISGSPVPAD